MDRTDDDPLLTVAETAARLGIAPASWRWHVHNGSAPPADDPGDGPVNRRTPRWKLSTVEAWKVVRRKRGGQPKRPEEET